MVSKVNKTVTYFLICVLISGFWVSSCNKDSAGSSEVVLRSYGPSPALRGGELKFIGQNLDKVTAVVLPSNIEIASSAFKMKTYEAIIIDVPQEAVAGTVKLIVPGGEIIPKTGFSISEPLSFASIAPSTVRPGDTVTITGNYLNLVHEVIFTTKKSVTTFQGQSGTQLKVVVPANARTGKVVLSNGAADPILIESVSDLQVILPGIAQIGPNPVKAGSQLTISGSNLDLVNTVVFGGEKSIQKAAFISQTATQIVVPVPADAKDGSIKVIPHSGIEVPSVASLAMLLPSISSIAPNPAKNTGAVTVTGTNLDLVSSVTFGGGKTGTISNASSTQITVSVPADAIDGALTFGTQSGKSVVSSLLLTLVVPAITNISPLTTAAHQQITITGTGLDVVKTVNFTGGYSANVSGATATQIVVEVTPGSISGIITLVTTNGTQVPSSQALTIVPNVPVITTIPSQIGVGELLVIQGTNLDIFSDIIFPGGVKATMYGIKSPTMIQVYVPVTATKGNGTIKFVTIDNEVLNQDIYIVQDILYYIYDDKLPSDWQQWGGWGLTSQDWANAEHTKRGTSAIKIVYSGSWGAIQAHPTVSTVLDGYTQVKLSIYGGAGTDGKKVQLYIKDAGGVIHPAVPLTIVEGAYTNYVIPLSSLGSPASITEFVIQDMGLAGTIYIDDIGLL